MSDVTSFDYWANRLNEILGRAQTALEDKDVAARVAVQKELGAFINQSPDLVAGQLDEIALKTINDIMFKTWDDCLLAVSQRTAELEKHVEVVQAITNTAVKDAASIKLMSARNAVDSAKKAVDALVALQNNMGGSPADVAGQVQAAIDALQPLIPKLSVLATPTP